LSAGKTTGSWGKGEIKMKWLDNEIDAAYRQMWFFIGLALLNLAVAIWCVL
jgi:hypothetical protein